jgi:adenylate cyclase
VRLACQLRPAGDIAVEPILRAERSAWTAAPPQRPPREGQVALLFFDVRLGAGTTTSNASPHDTIYALTQFQVILDCVAEPAGGVICSRGADHWVALFGLESGLQEGCRQAIAAARRIDQQASALSLRLADEMGLHTDFTIGVHAGPVVVGMIGRGEARTLSAVGEAVDAVAWLQQFAATRGAHFVISREAAAASGIDEASLEWQPLDAESESLPLCAVPATIPRVL